MSAAPVPVPPRLRPTDVAAASGLLSALAAPLRLSIVALLDEHGSRCVHELVEALGVAQPLVSQHLRVLRAARLVVGERRAREVHYRLVDGHVGHIVRDALDHAAHTITPPPTHPITPPPTHPITPPPTHPIASPPTHPVASPPTHPIASPPTHPIASPPTHPGTWSGDPAGTRRAILG